MIKVFLIDDHPLILNSIHAILSDDQEINVVGKNIGFSLETLDQLKDINPDVIVLDISMPEYDAFEIVPLLRKDLKHARIIIYTMHSLYRYLKYFFLMKVEGYVVKSSRTDNLIEAIKTVYSGDIYYPDHMLEKINQSEESMELNQIQFTVFEKILLENLNKNYTNKELAQIMNCSLNDILKARKKLLVKTNTYNIESLLKYVFS